MTSRGREASTILEVIAKQTTQRANEFLFAAGTCGLPRLASIVGLSERRRGPSEIASAFLFPTHWGPLRLRLPHQVRLVTCFVPESWTLCFQN